MSEVSAYEKMLKNGSAFKKINMNRMVEPDLSEAVGRRQSQLPREKQTEQEQIQPRNDNYEEFDSIMEQRVQSLRNKMNGKTTKKPMNELNEIISLKKRIKRLEDALVVIMKTHEELLG